MENAEIKSNKKGVDPITLYKNIVSLTDGTMENKGTVNIFRSKM